METTTRTRRTAGGALALAALVLGGLTACGGSPEALGAAGRAALHHQVETIRDTVDEGRPDKGGDNDRRNGKERHGGDDDDD